MMLNCVYAFAALEVRQESIGVRAGGARGAAAPQILGNSDFFGQQEKIWAKAAFKDVFTFWPLVF